MEAVGCPQLKANNARNDVDQISHNSSAGMRTHFHYDRNIVSAEDSQLLSLAQMD